MTIREKWRRFLLISIFFGIIAIFIYGCYYVKSVLPKQITVVVDEDGAVKFHVPFNGTITSVDKEVTFINEDTKISDTAVVGCGKSPVLNVTKAGSYELMYKLFGIFDFQRIRLKAIDDCRLIPVGITMGLYLETDGIMVVGTSELTDCDGNKVKPADGILQSGDYICCVNNRNIQSKDELIELVANSQGSEMVLTVRRNNRQLNISLQPVKVSENDYKLGIWVRDDCQGIGTVTFIDSKNHFGALGHSISDIDTGLVVDSHQGELRRSSVHSIRKGTDGKPGSVCGSICYDEKTLFGNVKGNTKQGVFGIITLDGKSCIADSYKNSGLKMEELPVGFSQEISTGKAYIRSDVSGKLTDYEINITAIDTSKNCRNKGIVLEVTDSRLIELTGGIVQGMSGSPIIQDGKIIGAVTHVLIQDASKGYGIFIEKMLETQYFLGGY